MTSLCRVLTLVSPKVFFSHDIDPVPNKVKARKLSCKDPQLSALTRPAPACLLFVWHVMVHFKGIFPSCSPASHPNISFHSPRLAQSLNVPGLHDAGPKHGATPLHSINMSRW